MEVLPRRSRLCRSEGSEGGGASHESLQSSGLGDPTRGCDHGLFRPRQSSSHQCQQYPPPPPLSPAPYCSFRMLLEMWTMLYPTSKPRDRLLLLMPSMIFSLVFTSGYPSLLLSPLPYPTLPSSLLLSPLLLSSPLPSPTLLTFSPSLISYADILSNHQECEKAIVYTEESLRLVLSHPSSNFLPSPSFVLFYFSFSSLPPLPSFLPLASLPLTVSLLVQAQQFQDLPLQCASTLLLVVDSSPPSSSSPHSTLTLCRRSCPLKSTTMTRHGSIKKRLRALVPPPGSLPSSPSSSPRSSSHPAGPGIYL
eukprot:122786-Hanusia_phi.AAC.2